MLQLRPPVIAPGSPPPPFWQRHGPLLALLGTGAGSWTIFGIVAHELHEDRAQPDQGFPFDRPLLDALHAAATPAACKLAAVFSDLSGPLWLIIYGLLLVVAGRQLGRHHFRRAAFLLTAIGGAIGANLIAKQVFGRVRPAFYSEVCGAPRQLLPDASFPSGHTMASLAIAITVGILCWPTRARWVAWSGGLTFAGGVAWSRMYLAAHYPSDVLAGWFAASAWVWTVYLAFTRYGGPLHRADGLAPAAPPRA